MLKSICFLTRSILDTDPDETNEVQKEHENANNTLLLGEMSEMLTSREYGKKG